MNDNRLKEKQIEIHISGVSIHSKEDAVNTAFKNIRTQVSNEIKGIILSIRPTSVKVEDLQIKEYTQRFLFLFMPKKKQKVKIDLKVTVDVQVLDI
ncbi:DUF4312 family protein [Faecalicoccus pleomorphus]|uniref:DUF4312 family protein n=1 Tax=Faecalicoccus pleomorphus TaxID=1323 RepID=UPI0022E775C2|nr:DUF4312 family protein [Faecalicoccus pleomorphus]MDB7987623.1 DUF4312 family protein [Faecalicoccus pleomorphus]MDB7991922.1 DUF4312 family protein [Faecalicoccus pleomorphus]